LARKKKEEAPAFEIPDFDEQEYMEKEMNTARMSFVDIGVGMALVGIGFGIMRALEGPLPKGLVLLFLVLVGVITRFPLRELYGRFGIDTEKLENKHLIGHGFTIFVTWVAVLTLLSNPPVSDFDDPHITKFEIYSFDANLDTYNETDSIAKGDVIQVRAKIYDNGKLDRNSLTVSLRVNDNSVPLTPGQAPMKRFNETDDPVYVVLTDYPVEETGSYELEITARDSFGNERQRTFGFVVEG